ncbi:MAG: ATP-grasp domain-containing protein [Clostridia bacterium]|nr:ATP-grasp domain-containing protein [Clostridia bacterium]
MKALILAGGLPQIELLKQLKERRIETVLADGNANAIARPYADRFVQLPIFDVEAVKNLAVAEQVDFLITVCADQVLLIVAQVSEMLGLPCYIDYQTAQNVSDKILMKRIFKANGIPTSRFVETSRFDPAAFADLRYPLVVKPVDAYSSRGVRKAENAQELEIFYREAQQISRSGSVIVEEYCPGTEISVDAFITNGKAKILCVSNSEKILDDGRFVIFRGRYPVAASPAVLQQIEEVAQKITDAFHLVNAPLLIQMINDGEHVSVLEFCARTGGNMKYLLIKYSCGVDVISAAIDLSLGIQPKIDPRDMGNRYVVNDFIYCRPGVFDRLEGFDQLQREGVLNEFHAIRPQGMKVTGVTSSSDRIAGVNICAGSLEEFNQKHRAFVARARILDPEGNDIMRHDLLPDLK